MVRKRMLISFFEDSHQCVAESSAVQRPELFHEENIDEVLRTTTRATTRISSGLGVNLLG
jgi:hypothetical protein